MARTQTALLALALALTTALAAPAVAEQEKEQDGDPSADEGGDAAGDAEPPAAETADEAAEQEAVDLAALRQEYLALRDRLFKSRARAAAVASAMYSTKLQVHLSYESARFYSIRRATIRLDGASVYEDTDGQVGKEAGNRAPRFEGFVAPGPHRLTVRIEAASNDDPRFETASEHTFSVVAPAGKQVVVRAVARDDGDIGYEWEKQAAGSYELELDVSVETRARKEAPEES